MKPIEIIDFPESGYEPLVDFETWRVAALTFCDDLKAENIKTMQRHSLTDEVFVLIEGTCTLYLGGDGIAPGDVRAVPMEKYKVYNIKKGVWHNHTMSEEGHVLIIENQNTCDDNSPIMPLNDLQIAEIRR